MIDMNSIVLQTFDCQYQQIFIYISLFEQNPLTVEIPIFLGKTLMIQKNCANFQMLIQ